MRSHQQQAQLVGGISLWILNQIRWSWASWKA